MDLSRGTWDNSRTIVYFSPQCIRRCKRGKNGCQQQIIGSCRAKVPGTDGQRLATARNSAMHFDGLEFITIQAGVVP